MIHVLVPMNFPQAHHRSVIELKSGHKKIKIEKDKKWQKKCIENYIYKSMIRLQCLVLIQTNGIFLKRSGKFGRYSAIRLLLSLECNILLVTLTQWPRTEP